MRQVLITGMFLVTIIGTFFWAPNDWDWEMMRAAVSCWKNETNPYYVSNLQSYACTTLSFPYLPIWLPVAKLLTLTTFYKGIYLVLFFLGVCLAPRHSEMLIVGTLALGLLFTLHGGNLVIVEFVLVCLFFRLLDTRWLKTAAFCLGVLSSIKLCPLIFALAWLSYQKRWQFIGITLVTFFGSIILSALTFSEWFETWLPCVLGMIPGQHSAAGEVALAGFLNQAVFPAWVSVIGFMGLTWVTVKKKFDFPMVMLLGLLLLPRIPPYAFLAYAAVPTLMIYKNSNDLVKWFIVLSNSVCFVLVALAGFQVVPRGNYQYWSVAVWVLPMVLSQFVDLRRFVFELPKRATT